MDPVWLLVALLFGFAVHQLRLPALVGFLLAGFVLNLLGETGGGLLEIAADTGVLLLLFSIGLKLRLSEFLTPAIWGGANLHVIASMALTLAGFKLVGVLGSMWFASLDWDAAAAIAFGLSFSSTIFAVKIFEERGETRARHALLAIGILIVQDLLAVLFLLLVEQKLPSAWALALLALPLARPLLLRLMEKAGHGEVLILFGLGMAIFGAELFKLVGLKDALGALVFGLLLSNHDKTVELAKALLSFKDLFLVGFFLSVGLIGLPSLADLGVVAVLLIVLLPVTMALYFYILTRFHVRARTAFLATLGLATFSEFGLIVASEGMLAGILDADWLVIIAIAIAGSFGIGSVLNQRAHYLYQRFEKALCRFETERCRSGQIPADIGTAEVLVAGMGRVGRGAYESMRENYGRRVVGVDVDAVKVSALREQGMEVVQGDAEDIDFWRDLRHSHLDLVMLALPTHDDMLTATRLLRQAGFRGRIGAVSRYEDERQALEEAGVDEAYNYYAEAGTGFADHIQRAMHRSGEPA